MSSPTVQTRRVSNLLQEVSRDRLTLIRLQWFIDYHLYKVRDVFGSSAFCFEKKLTFSMIFPLQFSLYTPEVSHGCLLRIKQVEKEIPNLATNQFQVPRETLGVYPP